MEQQQQQQQQPPSPPIGGLIPGAVSNGQLPDENYIEKLFPKCPAKQLQQTRANNFRQNRSSFRQNGGRQQQRRQNKLRAHNQLQQQQQQQQQLQKPQANQETLVDATRQQQSTPSAAGRGEKGHNESVKLKGRDWCNSSSDSSDDKEAAGVTSRGAYGPGAMKRSGSNQFGYDASSNVSGRAAASQTELPNDNVAAPNARLASHARPKTRKYTASKSLQQQLQRSQSGYKLDPRPPPVDASVAQANQGQADGRPASAATRGAEQMGPSTSDNGKNPSPASAAAAAASSPIRARDKDNKPVNRTCRGIVFSEPVPGLQASAGTLGDSRQPSPGQVGATNCANGNTGQAAVAAAECLAPKAQQLPQASSLSPQQTAQQRQQQTQKAVYESADFEHQTGKPDVARQEPEATYVIAANQPAVPALFESEAVQHHSKHIIDTALEGTATANESGNYLNATKPTSLDEPSRDEDKYINLFVYDNTIPQQRLNEDTEPPKEHARPPSPPPKNLLAHSNSHPQSVVHEDARRGLLAEDLSETELDVIRNDTSVEELCGFNEESETEAKRRLDIRRDQDTAQSENEHSSNGNKVQPKHHRSIGTLQTVDENPETNVDEEEEQEEEEEEEGIAKKEEEAAFDGHETAKTELIDIGENNIMLDEDTFKVLRKGGGVAPPGFPRRVRPTSSNNTTNSKHQDLVTSPPAHPSTLLQQVGNGPTSSEDFLLSPTSVSQPPLEKQLESSLVQENGAQPVEYYESSANTRTTQRPLDDSSNVPSSQPVAEETKTTCAETNMTEALNRVSISQGNFNEQPGQANNARQHHKLPNETSHFSIARSTNKPQTEQNEDPELPRSRMQFNTLSEAESEADEQPNIELNPSASSRPTKTKLSQERRHQTAQMIRPGTSSQANGMPDDDLAPATKTALVFPVLDEGLSSEAESCDDEADEDDDRAMEADVDADDDEDDEDDDEDADDDVDSPALPNERGSLQANIESFVRSSQNQASKPQNNLIGALQQQHQGVSSSTMAMSNSDPQQQLKSSTTSPYANFMPQPAHDGLDQSDLKSMPPNYPNQNGQANYWTGATSQPTLSTQPASMQSQFNLQRNQQGNNNNSNNLNMNRPNNYANRDEAKSVNRLSSDTDNETDRLLGSQRNEQLNKMNNNELASNSSASDRQNANSFASRQSNSREVLIEGVLFSVKYLGSTHTECEGRGEKEDRIHQAELAVHEVKFRNGDAQAPAEVQLFISTEKIMVLDDKHRKIMMDHSLRTISYIADIGDAIVLIVRKKSASMDASNELGRPMSKTSCHVFESNESHTITKSISQAFQVAYTELLKANGAGDSSGYLPKELDYQEVLNSQEMSMTELEMFARKDNQREVIVPKKKGEILGLSIVESGWGSVLPTAVIAGLKQDGPAYRCKKLSVGDQILSINGISLVGLSLADCQKILRRTKDQSVARLSVVPCPITVEVKIKRPDTKYQLGFSVQHGVICSLLRGGIAERGGVRVGHRIISINGTTVVGVPHDKIVTLLASSVGEIRMKTCLTSLYRHMLGEEKNVSFV